MSIILRTNKGSALTYDEMDRNQSQFYYSSSISPDGTKIRLHFTGSDNLDLATEDYGPTRYHEVQFPSTDITVPDAIAAGDNTQIQFNDNGAFGADSEFVYKKIENYLGVGTSDPLDRVDIQGDGTKGGSISLRGFSAGSGETKHAKINFNEGSTFIGRIGRTDPNNYNLYITNNYSTPAAGGRGDTYSKVKVAIGEVNDDESRVVSTFAKEGIYSRFGVGMGSVDPNRQGTFVGPQGIGISTSTLWDADQSFLAPIPFQIFSSTNDAGRHDLIPNDSDSSGLLISSPKDVNGGNIVVAINTDTTYKNEGFNIINAFSGNYTNSEVIASFQASGKVGINTNFPSDVGLTVAGNISGSGTLQIETVEDNATTYTELSAIGVTSTGLVKKIAAVAAPIPVGGIIMWSGAIGSIPSGWALCNGTNGTPDLRERFVVGAGGDNPDVKPTGGYAIGAEGGKTYSFGGVADADGGQNSTGTNLHTLTLGQMPQHSHTIGIRRGTHVNDPATPAGGGAPHDDTIKICNTVSSYNETSLKGANQGHRHTIPLTDNRPPYYALAFIMYVGS